jgi:hypothetical protein
MFGFLKKSSTPRKSPNRKSPNKPTRKHIGFTRIAGHVVFRYPNGKLATGNGNKVWKITNHKYPEMSGLYTQPEFKQLVNMPNNWIF